MSSSIAASNTVPGNPTALVETPAGAPAPASPDLVAESLTWGLALEFPPGWVVSCSDIETPNTLPRTVPACHRTLTPTVLQARSPSIGGRVLFQVVVIRFFRLMGLIAQSYQDLKTPYTTCGTGFPAGRDRLEHLPPSPMGMVAEVIVRPQAGMVDSSPVTAVASAVRWTRATRSTTSTCTLPAAVCAMTGTGATEPRPVTSSSIARLVGMALPWTSAVISGGYVFPNWMRSSSRGRRMSG